MAESRQLLFAAVLALVVIAIALYVRYSRHGSGTGGGSGVPNPCDSSKMPKLGTGVLCGPGSGGGFAWLTTTEPTKTGVTVPVGLVQQNAYTASDANCVTESACQGFCLNDDKCMYYSYDSGKQKSSAKCPTSGSVCTTYSGALPASIGAGTPGYVSGGIPASQLPAEPFAPNSMLAATAGARATAVHTTRGPSPFATDRCGNLGSDDCPYLGDHFSPNAGARATTAHAARGPSPFATDRCGNLGSDDCPYLGDH